MYMSNVCLFVVVEREQFKDIGKPESEGKEGGKRGERERERSAEEEDRRVKK